MFKKIINQVINMVIDLLKIKEEIESLPLHVFGNKPIVKNLKHLKISRKNINIYFKVNKKEYIFRINIKGLNKQSFKESKKEYKLLKILEKYNFTDNTKAIYFSKKGKYFSNSYIIVTYIRGKNIILNKENIKLIARKVALINKEKVFFLDKLKLEKEDFTTSLRNEFIKKEKYIHQKIPSLFKLYTNIRKKIDKNKPHGLNKDLYLVHGDLYYKNIISNNKKICFIDWEYLKISSPLLDIAKLFSNNNKKTLEKLFFKEYTKHFNKIDNINEKYLFYKDYQEYLWLVSSTKYYLEIIFENPIYTIKNNKKKIIKDIIRNYNKLLKKRYVDKDLNYLKKTLKI